MTEQEKNCADAIARAVTELPLPMKKLVQVYAEGLADAKEVANECNSGEQERKGLSGQAD